MTSKTFADLYEEAEQHEDYWVEGAVQDFTEELSRSMAARNVSRSELARRIGSSPAYVTKILRGNTNFTIASMVRLARAVGMELHIELAPLAAAVAGTSQKTELQGEPLRGPYQRLMERPGEGSALELQLHEDPSGALDDSE